MRVRKYPAKVPKGLIPQLAEYWCDCTIKVPEPCFSPRDEWREKLGYHHRPDMTVTPPVCIECKVPTTFTEIPRSTHLMVDNGTESYPCGWCGKTMQRLRHYPTRGHPTPEAIPQPQASSDTDTQRSEPIQSEAPTPQARRRRKVASEAPPVD